MTIYALLDPETLQIRYVGQTSSSPKKRLQSHIAKARTGAPFYVCRWIRKILTKYDYIPRHSEYGISALGRKFSVSQQTMSRIVNGVTHVG